MFEVMRLIQATAQSFVAYESQSSVTSNIRPRTSNSFQDRSPVRPDNIKPETLNFKHNSTTISPSDLLFDNGRTICRADIK
jgi:hypothetical protein